MTYADDTSLFPQLDERTIHANRRQNSAQALAAALQERPERTHSTFHELVDELANADQAGGR